MASIKIVAQNRKATHEYSLLERFEAGLMLTGTEVKSARAGKVNLNESWIDLSDQGEAYLRDAHISKYSHGSYSNHPETRARKLLLNRSELNKLEEHASQKGMTIIPLKMYFKNSWVKIEIAVARGKKLYDKREDTARKDAERSMERAIRSRNARK